MEKIKNGQNTMVASIQAKMDKLSAINCKLELNIVLMGKD